MLIFFNFFNFRKKIKLDFINYFPTLIPHIPTLIPHIPTLVSRIPTPFRTFPALPTFPP